MVIRKNITIGGSMMVAGHLINTSGLSAGLRGLFGGLFRRGGTGRSIPGAAPSARRFESKLELPCILKENTFYPLVRYMDMNRETASGQMGFVFYSPSNLLGIGLRSQGVASVLGDALGLSSVPANREGLIYRAMSLEGLIVNPHCVKGHLMFDWNRGFMDQSVRTSYYNYLSDLLPSFMTVIHSEANRFFFEFSGGGVDFARFMRPNIS